MTPNLKALLDRARELREKATPGPYESQSHIAGKWHRVSPLPISKLPKCEGGGWPLSKVEDALFIENACNNSPLFSVIIEVAVEALEGIYKINYL